MGTLIYISLVLAAFGLGVLVQKISLRRYVKNKGCPFQHACLVYNPEESKAAIKRVITLLIENDVPKKEIRELVKKSFN